MLGLYINRTKTQLMKNHSIKKKKSLHDSLIKEVFSNVPLGLSMKMEKDMKENLDRRRRAAYAAFEVLKGATDQITDHNLRANASATTALLAFCDEQR
ncbi:hypothetical protein KIN20_029403 [Parelaphostrongylus tenuis]|uniref:Uncharacterized protein n=1 Tax=Parelaphostrongylus tenuis TaxID=148309 RepID=A0AAD5R2Q0_PARTN|nr:hypothetical protein KIN20_029403 [Parelaphostrongylus tenuis]